MHDERAWVLGGAAGHAGVFAGAEDLAKFAAMVASGGLLPPGAPGAPGRFLKAETIALFSAAVDPEKHTRAMGWDTNCAAAAAYSSAGRAFGPAAFGHTGFTGTSVWVDPMPDAAAACWCVLLSNRVHPSRGPFMGATPDGWTPPTFVRTVAGKEVAGIVALRPLLADLAVELAAEPSAADSPTL